MSLKISILFFSISMIFSAAACTSQTVDDTTPEMVKNMLKLRGFQFSEKEFFRAIRLEDPQVVTAFLQAGIDPNAVNEDGETALVYAIREKDPKISKILLEKADVNKRDEKGNSPLHTAIASGKTETVDLLLKKNVDVNVPGSYKAIKNQSPLYQSIIKGDFELARELLKRKADPNLADSDGGLPLAEVVIRSDADPEFVKLLIESGADVNKQEANGSNALIYAASNKSLNPEAREKIVRLLLASGADKSIKNKNGEDALFWAQKMGNEKVAEMLR